MGLLERFSYISDLTANSFLVISQETRAHDAFIPKVRNFHDSRQVVPSLSEFLIQRELVMDPVMSSVKKDPAFEPEGKFVFSKIHVGHGRTDNGFYQDGLFGVSLGFRSESDETLSWFAHTSFSVPTLLWWLPFDDKYRINEMHKLSAPVIVQLQARVNYPESLVHSAQTAMEMIRKYRWEFAMIGTLIDWAEQAGASKIHMLPAEYQLYNYNFGQEQFRMRYDVSAKRMGFRREPGGLNTLSLPTAIPE